jgi:hypothetical protein
MSGWQWALVLRPLVLLIFLGGIVAPIRWAIMKRIPEGKLRRLLLTRLN